MLYAREQRCGATPRTL
uniref:UBiQuitin family member n=1 Tax=Arundo donax TaxID=35708 RepID=A0A0A9BW73_ARUDO